MRIRLDVVQGRGMPCQIQLEAASADEACMQATRMGYSVLSTRVVSLQWPRFRAGSQAGASIDVAVFIEQLRDLLLAGLSVIEALEALRRGAQGPAVAVIERIERQLREGKMLSDALDGVPLFPALLVALVRASELTSDLPLSLTRFLEHEQRVTEVRHRLVSAAIYPALLSGVGALVLGFLLFYVMPRFARIFEGMGAALPWTARAMVAWAHWLGGSGGWWMLSMLVLGLAMLAAVGLPQVRQRLLARVLTWAPLRERLFTYFLARWYRATGMLVQGGIALPLALMLANGLLPAGLQAAGQAVWRGVNDGLSPAAAYVRAHMATAVAEQLMRAGERTGDLGAVLTRIAQFHEADASRRLERTMRALEPIMMVIIGLSVGFVVVMMYLPIFELASAIQ